MDDIKILKVIKKYVTFIVFVLMMLAISACSVYWLKSEHVEATVNEASDDEYKEVKVRDLTEKTEEEIIEEEPDISQFIVPFDMEQISSYCTSPKVLIDITGNILTFSFDFKDGIPESDDDNVYLFAIATYESENEIDEKDPAGVSKKNLSVELQLPFENSMLFSRFIPAILVDGKYIALYSGQYISNPEILSENTREYLNIDSKKGILLDANTVDKEELYDLNVKRVVYNIPLSLIIGESDNEVFPSIEYKYNNETYYFNGYYVAGYDSLFSYLEKQGIHSTAIILNDYNKKFPQIMHPLSRKKTSKSLYYAFNTEEEEGVRLLEATAMFLAERYSCGDYGMVYDWVIANEINQQTIWNYMATSDIDYYTESFEKAFRIFYNAIKSNYSSAKVYFSIDHDWNNNGGNNLKYFNGRDLLYKFNEYAAKGGNYNWSLSIHPYPNPLPRVRFWKGEFDKTEYAKVVTPMNLSSLTDVMRKEEFLGLDGEVRDIAITELGFSSRGGEKIQAAAFAYCYYIVEDNEYISSFLMNRQTDDLEALKSGLALGIYNNDYSPKYIKNIFSIVDSEKRQEYLPELLEIIGAKSIEEALSWAK